MKPLHIPVPDGQVDIYTHRINRLILGETAQAAEILAELHDELKSNGHLGAFLTDMIEQAMRENKVVICAHTGQSYKGGQGCVTFYSETPFIHLVTGNQHSRKKLLYSLAHEYAHFFAHQCNPGGYSVPFKSYNIQKNFLALWHHARDNFYEKELIYRVVFGNASVDELERYLFKYPQVLAELQAKGNLPRQNKIRASEIFATHFQINIELPELSNQISTGPSRLIYKQLFKKPGLKNASFTAKSVCAKLWPRKFRKYSPSSQDIWQRHKIIAQYKITVDSA